MDCGLVVDRVLGYHGGGGQRARGGEDAPAPPPLRERDFLVLLPPEERARARARGRIADCLSVFHMDTEDTVELALDNFWRIYGGRASGRRGFRKSESKELVAVAFSICNTLARQGIPRPPDYITDVLGLTPREKSALLKIPAALNLDAEERVRLRRCDYELKNIEAEEYIDTLCSILEVPFHLAGRARETAQRATWLLHGRLPTVLAAASLQLELERAGLPNLRERRRAICEQLHCTQKSVSETISRLVKLLPQHEVAAPAPAAAAAAAARRSPLQRHHRRHPAGQNNLRCHEGGQGGQAGHAGGESRAGGQERRQDRQGGQSREGAEGHQVGEGGQGSQGGEETHEEEGRQGRQGDEAVEEGALSPLGQARHARRQLVALSVFLEVWRQGVERERRHRVDEPRRGGGQAPLGAGDGEEAAVAAPRHDLGAVGESEVPRALGLEEGETADRRPDDHQARETRRRERRERRRRGRSLQETPSPKIARKSI